ncbi:MAG: hypothetical protein J3K34DRAFT_10309 [Monoraphidium minutum]|nr:MAG: hypothetical protein J3K34DRAFT_10309 [Monoraphidium minutum]
MMIVCTRWAARPTAPQQQTRRSRAAEVRAAPAEQPCAQWAPGRSLWGLHTKTSGAAPASRGRGGGAHARVCTRVWPAPAARARGGRAEKRRRASRAAQWRAVARGRGGPWGLARLQGSPGGGPYLGGWQGVAGVARGRPLLGWLARCRGRPGAALGWLVTQGVRYRRLTKRAEPRRRKAQGRGAGLEKQWRPPEIQPTP